MSEVFRIHITPQTHVRTVKKEKWMMVQTDEYLINYGKKVYEEKLAENKDTKFNPNAYLNRRNTMKKYFDYKRKLQEEFLKCGLKEYPTDNVWFKFYIPMPKSWPRKKRLKHNFEKHISKPDRGNLEKAIEDSLSIKDQLNWDCRSSKFWIDLPYGFIEIHLNALPEAKGYTSFQREDKIK